MRLTKGLHELEYRHGVEWKKERCVVNGGDSGNVEVLPVYREGVMRSSIPLSEKKLPGAAASRVHGTSPVVHSEKRQSRNYHF